MKQVKPAKGIRNKILYGFIILGYLLFFSGLISFFELSRLSSSTKNILENSHNDMELTNKMLNAVQTYDVLLQQIIDSDEVSDSFVYVAREHFESIFYESYEKLGYTGKMDEVILSKNNFSLMADEIINDSLFDDRKWAYDLYKSSYYDLNLAIKNFMLSIQDSVDNNTIFLSNNAYRAIMPGIITLGIAIIIVIVFFGLIDLYYIKPVLKMTKGLEEFLKNRVPFKAGMEGTDEIKELRSYIEELLSMVKKGSKQ